MSFYISLMLLDPLADPRIFVWSKIPMLLLSLHSRMCESHTSASPSTSGSSSSFYLLPTAAAHLPPTHPSPHAAAGLLSRLACFPAWPQRVASRARAPGPAPAVLGLREAAAAGARQAVPDAAPAVGEKKGRKPRVLVAGGGICGLVLRWRHDAGSTR